MSAKKLHAMCRKMPLCEYVLILRAPFCTSNCYTSTNYLSVIKRARSYQINYWQTIYIVVVIHMFPILPNSRVFTYILYVLLILKQTFAKMIINIILEEFIKMPTVTVNTLLMQETSA